jgi:hypothetical protein
LLSIFGSDHMPQLCNICKLLQGCDEACQCFDVVDEDQEEDWSQYWPPSLLHSRLAFPLYSARLDSTALIAGGYGLLPWLGIGIKETNAGIVIPVSIIQSGTRP